MLSRCSKTQTSVTLNSIRQVNQPGRTQFVVNSLFTCLFLVLAVAGCGGDSASIDVSESKETKAPRIALVMKSLSNEFFSTMAKGAEQHQAAHPEQYKLLVNGIKDERDVGRQVTIVNEMIAQQVDALVIAPADSKALISACKAAQDAGIVVINIDNKLDADILKQSNMVIPFVGPDNRQGAHKVGEYLASKLQAGDEVALLEGVPTAFNAQQRKAGFVEAIEAAKLNLVSSQSADWEMNRANKFTSDILTTQPNLKAIFCSNDSMALGALAAVRAAGKIEQVQIVGFDNISAVQTAVSKGEILATADQHGDQLAVFGIEYALQILNEKVTPTDKETPVDLVTKETLNTNKPGE